MRRYDAVAVGSGINSLVAAALLAKRGWRVCVLERNAWLGGAIRTAEITEPGFVHEVFASWHPLFTGSAAYAQLKPDLDARGVEYLNTDLPTATLFPDGSSAFLTTSHEENVAELGPGWDRTVAEFLPNADLSFGVLGTELWSRDGARLGSKALRRLGRRGLVEFAGNMLAELPRLDGGDVRGRARVRALRAVGAAHRPRPGRGLVRVHGPGDRRRDRAGRDAGAARRRREARRGARRDRPGRGRRVRDRPARSSASSSSSAARPACGRPDGEVIEATRAVLANVTPQALYGHLLGGDGPVEEAQAVPLRPRRDADPLRALGAAGAGSGDARLGRTAIVHLTPGLNGVSRAVNEAERGLLPAEATVVVGQPMAVDPSRAPDGSWILWIQLQEVPSRPVGDAAGELDTGDGTWTEALREAYADRIQARIAAARAELRACAPAARRLLAGRHRGGEPEHARRRHLRRLVRARPEPDLAPAPRRCPATGRTSSGLWHIGACTHPGPGLGAGSGTLVAKELLKRRRWGSR